MDTWIAAIASFLGGAGFSGVLKFITTQRTLKNTNEQTLRAELAEQLAKMNERIQHLETEVDEWRQKYLELYKAHADLKAEVEQKRTSRKKEVTE